MDTMPMTPNQPMTTQQPIYWRKNEVTLTFVAGEDIVPLNKIPETVDAQLQELSDQVFKKRFILNRGATRSTHAQIGITDMDGIYVYTSPDSVNKALLTFNEFAVACTVTPPTHSMAAQNMDSAMHDDTKDITLQVVKQLNDHARTTKPRINYFAMPTWLFTGVPDETHGCPISPPFPVKAPGITGLCKTRLPHLPHALQAATGSGVTVFILDAFPQPDVILRAAKAAGSQNMLLQHMVAGINGEFPRRAEPPAIGLDYTYKIPGPLETAVTGKDIYGRLSGFPMPDHGIFIAGLVRDLAPKAHIECIRILNDYGVGDAQALYQALTSIEKRQHSGGDLHGKPIVVNLSLVIGPPECDLARLGLTTSLKDPTQADKDVQSLPVLLQGLLNLLQSMANQGATFVASVGNDSDPRDFSMNPSETRFNARYPAAFATHNPDFPLFKHIIPVGAVNHSGQPASYSNYPGPYGISTYGGEIPKPDPWFPSASSHVIATVDTSAPIDALCGVYTAPAYPALSRNDHLPPSMQPQPDSPTTPPAAIPYPLYSATSQSAWAYWSGTSFAAPIITALAARVLQGMHAPFDNAPVHDAIAAIAQDISWTSLENSPDTSGKMIPATQSWTSHNASTS